MKSFLVRDPEIESNTTLRQEGRNEDMVNEYTQAINPNNYVIDYKKLADLKLIKNVGASNIFKVLTANFVKSLKNKEDFV